MSPPSPLPGAFRPAAPENLPGEPAVNPHDAFERILASLHRATLDDAHTGAAKGSPRHPDARPGLSVVEGGQASAFERWATPRARLTRRRRFMKNRVEAQGRNQTHPTAPTGMREFHDTAGLITQHGDRDVWQPTTYQPDQLTCPLGDGLVPQPQALTDLGCWRRYAQSLPRT